MNTTLIEAKALADYDAVVLDAMTLVPATPASVSAERLLIGVRNEHGDVYRVIRISGLSHFLALIEKLRELGFTDELAESAGDKEGYDAIVTGPGNA